MTRYVYSHGTIMRTGRRIMMWLWLVLWLFMTSLEYCNFMGAHAFSTTTSTTSVSYQSQPYNHINHHHGVVCFMVVDPKDAARRQAEIRRKITSLQRQGRLLKKEKKSTTSTSSSDDITPPVSPKQEYASKVQAKLGTQKAKLLGWTSLEQEEEEYNDDDDYDEEEMEAELNEYEPPPLQEEEETTNVETTTITRKPIIDPSLFDSKDDDQDQPEPTDEELVELVAQKLQEQSRPNQTTNKKKDEKEENNRRSISVLPQDFQPTITTGVGGTWNTNTTTTTTQAMETYQPKSGSWGAFPRPKDISKAYGGGRRVGAGFDQSSLLASQQDTRLRLQQYREKVGIEVASEKEHAKDIDEALRLAGYAMQRGMYSSAVSCLEKVTQYCSTNSKVGGKVFLELAMAYEAEGRTQEAVTVYSTLAKSRIEEIKFDAKRLLYGIEAMEFMRNEARSEAFSRKKIRNTFIDTTGLAHIAENFDDVYETAYIDLSSNFYRRLTENVVRSNREARQILLQSTGSGMVEHMKIVQALRSISRHFDSALEEEQKAAAPQSVAVMNGKPIVQQRESSVATMIAGMDEYVLASPKQMLEMLEGEWRLQLVADRQGDGVKYNNNSTLQTIDTEAMSFRSTGPAGFVKVSQSGNLEFNDEKRILSKVNVNTSGGGVLSGLIGGGKSNTLTAAQQVVSVDSTLLVTRLAPDKKRLAADSVKGYFSVWRRVGTPLGWNESDLED